jgi:hypothetical protein
MKIILYLAIALVAWWVMRTGEHEGNEVLEAMLVEDGEE